MKSYFFIYALMILTVTNQVDEGRNINLLKYTLLMINFLICRLTIVHPLTIPDQNVIISPDVISSLVAYFKSNSKKSQILRELLGSSFPTSSTAQPVLSTLSTKKDQEKIPKNRISRIK